MRVWNYVECLHAAIEAAKTRTFDYGQENCVLFAAQCIDAIVVGSNLVAELKAQYPDEAAARAAVAAGLEAVVTARLGAPKPWPRARRGDVCLMPTQEGPGLGVCVGAHVAMMSPVGISYLKLDRAIAIWSID